MGVGRRQRSARRTCQTRHKHRQCAPSLSLVLAFPSASSVYSLSSRQPQHVANTGSMGTQSRTRNGQYSRSHRQVPLRCIGQLSSCPQPCPSSSRCAPLLQDTEFPGVVARPIGAFKTSSDYHYQTMRCNVDLLKIIQVGLTLADEEGTFPQEVSTWQFNFKFSTEYVFNSSTQCHPSPLSTIHKSAVALMPRIRAYVIITETTCTLPSRLISSRARASTFNGIPIWVSSRTTLLSS